LGLPSRAERSAASSSAIVAWSSRGMRIFVRGATPSI